MTSHGMTLSENLKAAVRSVSEAEWTRLFDQIKNQELAQLGTLTPGALTELQARVNLITDMKQLFKELRTTS